MHIIYSIACNKSGLFKLILPVSALEMLITYFLKNRSHLCHTDNFDTIFQVTVKSLEVSTHSEGDYLKSHFIQSSVIFLFIYISYFVDFPGNTAV